MNDAAMPHVDLIAKLELDAIYDILQNDPDSASIALEQFLQNVHVLRSRGLESFTNVETESQVEDTKAEKPKICAVCGGEGEHDWEVHYAEFRYASDS